MNSFGYSQRFAGSFKRETQVYSAETRASQAAARVYMLPSVLKRRAWWFRTVSPRCLARGRVGRGEWRAGGLSARKEGTVG